LLVIMLTVVGSIKMMKPFNRAVDAQKELAVAYGERGEFVPPVGGLNAERIEKFMAVRRDLVPLCANFTEIGESFQRMDELDNEGEEPSKGELFGALGNVMGSVFGIAGNIGRFTEARNEALLREGMGLGEYIWIYTLAYNSWLDYEPNTGFEADEGGAFSNVEQRVIRQLMRNHVDALVAAGQQAEADSWLEEIRRLERSEGPGVPWEEQELPAGISAALAPFQTALSDLYCAATASFEFSQVTKKGLSITAN
jgi:hypothetical protein